MKSSIANLVSIVTALAFAAWCGTGSAESTSVTRAGQGHTSVDKSIEYHNGPVMIGNANVYFIWYGCWGLTGCGDAESASNDGPTQAIVTDFVSSVGLSPYAMIDTGYPDQNGNRPTGVVFYGGGIGDYYSHGPSLSEADVEAIVSGALQRGALPADPSGIYVVLGSSDISVDDTATHLCLTCCEFHRHSTFNGSPFRYIFVGNPSRCPTGCAQQFAAQPSPNGNYAADAIASWLAHALNGVLTNPDGTGWYDRYGLENADKCAGTYGQTYTVTNPDGETALANIQLGWRHFLVEQNWVNGKKGACALSLTP